MRKIRGSFFTKIFASFVAVTILVTSLLSLFVFFGYKENTMTLAESFFGKIMRQTNYSVSYMNDLAKRLSVSLYSDKSVVAFLNMSKRDNMTTVVANTAVRKITLPLTYVESVYLYNGKEDLLLSTRNGEQTTLEACSDTTLVKYFTSPELLCSLGSRPIVHTVQKNKIDTEICSYVLHETDTQGNLLNFLVINLNTSTLINSIEEITGSARNGEEKTQAVTSATFMVADADGKIIGSPAFYSDDKNRQAIDAVIARQQAGRDPALFPVRVGDKTYFSLWNDDNANGWLIIGLSDSAVLYSKLWNTVGMSILFDIALLLATTVLCLFLARRLNSPLKAITRLVQGENACPELVPGVNTGEFAYLGSVFSTMQEENRRFLAFRDEKESSIQREFLLSLIREANVYSLEKTEETLKELKLSFISSSQLCLCVMKVDRYRQFVQEKNQQECWAYRYAAANIADELISDRFPCQVIPTDSDKLVAIIDCGPQGEAYQDLPAVLETLIPSIRKSLELSVTVAYSGVFSGIQRLPFIYGTTVELSRLKLYYGDGALINPLMLEETQFDRQEVLPAEEEMLKEKILSADDTAAGECFRLIVEKLYTYARGDILPYSLYLSYLLWGSLCGKYPMLREEISGAFGDCVAGLSECELLSDIADLVLDFISVMCHKVARIREHSDNSSIIVARVHEIVNKEIANRDLCLNFAAESIGLSANYIGAVFKAAQGISVAKFIQEQRMELVADYLKTTKYPLQKILDLCGLELNNYFYTTFKKHFGLSLGKYRLTATAVHQGDKPE